MRVYVARRACPLPGANWVLLYVHTVTFGTGFNGVGYSCRNNIRRRVIFALPIGSMLPPQQTYLSNNIEPKAQPSFGRKKKKKEQVVLYSSKSSSFFGWRLFVCNRNSAKIFSSLFVLVIHEPHNSGRPRRTKIFQKKKGAAFPLYYSRFSY